MILPEKHIRLAESFLGLGGVILKFLVNPKSVDVLWVEFEKVNNSGYFPAYHSFDNFILALDYLFMIGAVELDNEGRLYLAID